MISFMNMMGGKNPLDDPEDDSEEGSGNKKKTTVSNFIGWQDALVLIVIAILIIGGYKYYQYTKQKSAEMFTRCAVLFDAEDYPSAKACYDSTWDLNYATPAFDSLRVLRLGFIEDMQNTQEDVFESVKRALVSHDTVAAVKAMQKFSGPVLLEKDDAEIWEEWKKTFPQSVPVDTATKTDSLLSK
ncbi:MAG: hypothetical protein M0P13_02415 [Fibrobacteraceae bacterium]|nr:hypothetical protein [Fibrobacteraceae bacterium]